MGRDHSIECERCGVSYGGFDGPDECLECKRGDELPPYASDPDGVKNEIRGMRDLITEVDDMIRTADPANVAATAERVMGICRRYTMAQAMSAIVHLVGELQRVKARVV